MINTILLRYGEIHLKGTNRPFFERLLVQNIKAALQGYGCNVFRGDGRFYVNGFRPEQQEEVAERVKNVFGLYSISPAVECEKELETIEKTLVDLLKENEKTTGSFKVRAKRSDKHYPLASLEICREVGGYLLTQFPELTVDVHHPDFFVDVEIREQAYVYIESIPAVGGMPVGSNGRAMLLLSGGIDSPVAGYSIAKRGVELEAVYFHSFPYTSERAKMKVIDLATIMSRYCGPIKLHVVNFTPIQTALYEKCKEEQITVLMRRMMMRVAEGLAQRQKALALVTGESLGQVASQTIQSLNATNAVVSMPVFRPLIGFDKVDIIAKAREIGTYDTSILPYEDCCTVFVPKHPVTKPRIRDMEHSEKLLDYAPMVQEAIETAEEITVTPAM